MVENTNPLPLSNHLSLSTEDPRLICSHLKHSYRPSLISFPNKENPKFTHNQAEFGSLKLNSISYGSRTFIKSDPIKNDYLAVMTLSGQGHFKNKKNNLTTTAGDLILLNPSDQLDIELSDSFQQIAIQLTAQSLQNNVSEQIGYQLDYPLKFESLHKKKKDLGKSLKALICLTLDDINNNCTLMNNKQTLFHTENLIISLILEEFENNYMAFLNEKYQPCKPKYVQQAQCYIRDNYGSDINIKQLSQEINTTPRSLQMGFKKYLSTTPTNYIKSVRLEIARKILTSPSITPPNITSIALSCGFNHLSNFTKQYKQTYGLTPSETLTKNRQN